MAGLPEGTVRPYGAEMAGRWGRALLAAGAMGAGAYALLREEEDRRKDLEALDGALGGWLSWAMNDPKPVTATVQMDCTPPLPVDTPEAPTKAATDIRQPAALIDQMLVSVRPIIKE